MIETNNWNAWDRKSFGSRLFPQESERKWIDSVCLEKHLKKISKNIKQTILNSRSNAICVNDLCECKHTAALWPFEIMHYNRHVRKDGNWFKLFKHAHNHSNCFQSHFIHSVNFFIFSRSATRPEYAIILYTIHNWFRKCTGTEYLHRIRLVQWWFYFKKCTLKLISTMNLFISFLAIPNLICLKITRL